jgi:hypothetical protein
MRTPAAAIAWEFARRHRWGLLALLGTIGTLGSIKLAVLTSAGPLQLREVTFALLVPVPFAASFLYLLAVFTFGISGDLAARESMFPPRMLALPVSSAALAGWPMLYGGLAMALLWFALRIAGIFPSDFPVPTYWPALFAASLLAWTQALTWMPYPFRGMRVIASIAVLISIDVVVFTALETRARESTMLLLLSPLLPLAYVTARSAVRRARCGDVPEWSFARRAAAPRGPATSLRAFSSASRAQLWLEWRQFGRTLPTLVAVVLPVGMALLFLFHQTPVIVIEIVATSLMLPPFLGIFVAAAAGKSSATASQSYGITPFLATRPIDDRALVRAKWQAAALSTLAAWGIIVVVVPIAVIWADAAEPILNIARNVDDALGRPRAVALGLLVLAALVGSTWKQLVQGLYLTMSGRDWAVKGIAFATLVVVTAAFLILGWILESRHRIVAVWYAIPSIMAALVALKLLLAMRVMQRGLARGLFTRPQLIRAAVIWDACVFAVYGLLVLALPAILARRSFLMLAAILLVPFVRLAAAPLAVARNRHR